MFWVIQNTVSVSIFNLYYSIRIGIGLIGNRARPLYGAVGWTANRRFLEK